MALNPEDFLAAQLARSVGQTLHTIDNLTIQSSSNGPANRIEMSKFVAPLVQNRQGNVPTPSGGPIPLPEELVQRLVPDVPQAPPHLAVTSANQLPPIHNNLLERICIALETIAKAYEKKPKKKPRKRKTVKESIISGIPDPVPSIDANFQPSTSEWTQ